jgi:hypothetical protein
LRKWAALQMEGKILDIGSGKGVYRFLLGTSDIVRMDIERKYLEGDWGSKVLGSAALLPYADSSLDGIWAEGTRRDLLRLVIISAAFGAKTHGGLLSRWATEVKQEELDAGKYRKRENVSRRKLQLS